MLPIVRQRGLTWALALALVTPMAWTAPDARLSLGTPLGEVPRIGVNLGSRSVWGAEQLMSNVLRNPGLEATLDGALIVVAAIDGARVTDDARWTARSPGFWVGASYEVLSGAAAGQRGQVIDNQRRSEQAPDTLTLQAPVPGLRAGDVVAVQGLQDFTAAPLWWTQGLVQAVAEARPGSPGVRAVRLTATPGQPAALLHHLDSIGARAGKLLPVQGRWRLALWLRATHATARVRLSFGRQGRPLWLNRTLQPGTAWQAVELVFDTQDEGLAGPLMLAITAEGGAVLADDIELGAVAPPRAGGFRAEVVDNLRSLRPGYLRDWQGQLADNPANRDAGAFARHPIRYRPGAAEALFAYSLTEFMALSAEVGARPWVVLPATTTPAQARAFGQGLAQAWQRHGFDEIVVEHGNEHWNSIFRPAGIASAPVLAEVADRAFAALREGAGPHVRLHRVIGTQFVDAAAAGRMAKLSRHSEGVAVAPYFHYRQAAGETTVAALERALREGAEPLVKAQADLAPSGRSLDVYEVNFHTTGGTASATERDAVLLAPEAGTALMRRLLQATALGVKRQAVYTLAGYDSFVDGPSRQLTALFGITRDLARSGNWRPTGAVVVALNRAIGGPAHRATCAGPSCADVTAMAFGGGSRWAVASAASAPVEVSWPCQTAQHLTSFTGVVSEAPCVQGRITVTVPPRGWVVAYAAAP